MKQNRTGKGRRQRLVPCMPPFLEEEEQNYSSAGGQTMYGGKACEDIVTSYFLSNNVNVAKPFIDTGVDLLIEKPSGWIKAQVKKVVYQNKLDYTHKKNFGGEIYRSRFNFNFQSCSGSKGRGQKRPQDFDYFYHVILTPYRQLIWETPVDVIPVREDGTFIHGKNPVIDRNNWIRKKADIDFNQYLIHTQYHPIIFEKFSDFFVKSNLKKFFESDENDQ